MVYFDLHPMGESLMGVLTTGVGAEGGGLGGTLLPETVINGR